MGSPEITKTLRSQPQARGCFLHMEKMIGSLTIQSWGTLRVTSISSPWRQIAELIPRSGCALFVPMNTMQQQMVAVWHSKSSQMIGCALCVDSQNRRTRSRAQTHPRLTSGCAIFVPMNPMQQQMVAVWHSKSSQMIGCALCVHSQN